MNLTFEQQYCIGEAACVMACPMKIIQLTNEDNKKVIRITEPDSCLRCGVCVQVCTYGALQFGPFYEEVVNINQLKQQQTILDDC